MGSFGELTFSLNLRYRRIHKYFSPCFILIRDVTPLITPNPAPTQPQPQPTTPNPQPPTPNPNPPPFCTLHPAKWKWSALISNISFKCPNQHNRKPIFGYCYNTHTLTILPIYIIDEHSNFQIRSRSHSLRTKQKPLLFSMHKKSEAHRQKTANSQTTLFRKNTAYATVWEAF